MSCFHAQQTVLKPAHMTFRFRPDYNLPLRLRVIESYQHSQFSQSAVECFYHNKFVVTPNSDRMGYRLQGESVTPPENPILSEGIALAPFKFHPTDNRSFCLMIDKQLVAIPNSVVWRELTYPV